MDPSAKLPGATVKRLQEALLAAFPTRSTLAQMVRVGLDENLEAIAAPGDLRAAVFQLLVWAESRGHVPALLACARRENPGNAALRTFAEELAGERVPAPFHVPFLPNPSFVGREDDLARLHALLQKGAAVGVRPAALTGMGGIGKTQLAVEYAYRYAEAYPGGVYWVNAAQPLQAEFARLAVASGLTAGETSDAERTMRLALAFAKHLGERPDALAIFDNVDNPLALRSPEPGFIPEQLGCRLLFTTRRRAADSPFETVDVRVLPQDVALRLLLGEARRALLDGGPGAELDAAKATCGSVGCLPLALVLAAAFLARYPRIAVADYLKRIRKEGALAATDAGKVDKNTLGTRHDAAVGATLRTQWDALESEDAKLVLKAAALLGEAVVVPRARLSLLTGLAETAEPGYPAAMEDALLQLRGLSLVEELTEHEIRLHPLVREFAETQIVGREAFAAGCAGRLGEALWDMGRLHDEVAGRGIYAVLGDLRVGSKLAGASERGRIEALRRPLDRESHALRRWDREEEPGFLLQQLRNRCLDMGVEDGVGPRHGPGAPHPQRAYRLGAWGGGDVGWPLRRLRLLR
jgi:Effector-associated domain 1/NB-ARC domain